MIITPSLRCADTLATTEALGSTETDRNGANASLMILLALLYSRSLTSKRVRYLHYSCKNPCHHYVFLYLLQHSILDVASVSNCERYARPLCCIPISCVCISTEWHKPGRTVGYAPVVCNNCRSRLNCSALICSSSP